MKTADLTDKYPDLQVCEPIFQSYGGNALFGGPIRTVECFEDFSRVRELVEEKSDGGVMVVDAGGSLRCAMLGDMLASKAVDNGWVGAVYFGLIRDSAEINQMPFGVKALGVIPTRSARNGQGVIDVPVKFAGVTFNPGDYLYADEDGVVVSDRPLEL